MRSLRLLLASALALPGPAAAQVSHTFSTSAASYYDAINAAAASQMLGIPMPVLRGEPGDFKLAVTPGYVSVEPNPLKLRGGSLTLGYSRLREGPWGVYGAAFATLLRTQETTDSGVPDPDLMTISFQNLDAAPSYAGTHPGGASVGNFTVGAGVSYRVRDREGAAPITFFGGPFLTYLLLEDQQYRYSFTGTSGGQPYTLDGERNSTLRQLYGGVTVGAAAEYELGKHFKIGPHFFFVAMRVLQQSADTTLRHVETLNGGPLNDQTFVFGPPRADRLVYFPVPGVDLTYRDWGLSVNILEPITGMAAHSILQRAHKGDWPFTLRVTKHFGNYRK